MPSYKLIYFNVRGRAESIRVAFACGNIAYEDVRVNGESWPDHKKEAPLGQAPYLKVDNTVIGDSAAIIRYVAGLAGLVPESSLQVAQADMISGGITDMKNKLVKAHYEQDKDKQAELKKEIDEKTMPQFLGYLDNILKSCGGDSFFIGNKISYADIEYFDLINSCFGKGAPEVPECLKDHPGLIKVYKAVATVPNIEQYLENRPKTER